MKLAASIAMCAEYPDVGVAWPSMGNGIRSVVSGSHVIFYRRRERGPGVFVIRILHQSQDGKRHL